MRRSKILPAVFAVLGFLLALGTVILSLGSLDAAPVLVQTPQDAAIRSEALMEALAEGDFARAETVLYGTPSLGADREAADEVGQLIWDAFTDSLDYTFTGELYTVDSGLARDVKITTLEIASVTETLKERSEVLLEERVQSAGDVSQIYDENNDYREDFVMAVLYDAVSQSLQEDARYETREITLKLVFSQGQWWVMPDQALLQVISGGTAG